MAEDKGKEEEKFDFTAEGEGLLTLGDARMLAVRTAAESPGDYGRNLRDVAMVFEIVESGEDADYYTVTLSVRPQGNFVGTAGQEQFLIRQDGTIAVRQVLSLPTQTSASPAGTARKGGGFPMLPAAIGVVVVVGIIAAVGAILLMNSSGGDSVPIAAVPPTETPAPVVIPADTPEPTVNIDATVQAGIQQGLAERPASVPVPKATYIPIPPPFCFVMGTPILTSTGYIAIEELEKGDTVLSYDHDFTKRGEFSESPLMESNIVAIASRQVKELMLVNLADLTSIQVTSEHPFYSPDESRYKPIGEFKPGERLAKIGHTKKLETVVVLGVKVVHGEFSVYNLSVDSSHHNYVAAGVLVHNKTSVPTRIPILIPTPTPTPTLKFVLTTQVSPSTGGEVTSGGIYTKGTSVEITTVRYKNYTFNGWSGACSGAGKCVVTMNGHMTVTANYSLDQYTMTANANPSSGGLMSGGGKYSPGALATVYNRPHTGYTFSGWSGACSGTGECVVTMNGNKTVTANFSLIPATPRSKPTATPNASSYYNKGEDYYEAENWVMAVGEFTNAIQVNPDYEDAYYYRGISYRNLGQYQNAIDDQTKAIQLDPDDAYNYYERANAYGSLGQYQLAINDYTKAIQIEPTTSRYNNRGVSYEKLGQYQTAINDYNKAIQLDPDYAVAYGNRGLSYERLGQYQTAINDYTKAIQLDPDDDWTYRLRGNSYYELGQYQTAITDYNKAIQLDPDSAKAYGGRGNAYDSLGQYQQAILDLDMAIQLDPDYAWAHYIRAFVYRNLGQYALANADDARACSLDSKHC